MSDETQDDALPFVDELKVGNVMWDFPDTGIRMNVWLTGDVGFDAVRLQSAAESVRQWLIADAETAALFEGPKSQPPVPAPRGIPQQPAPQNAGQFANTAQVPFGFKQKLRVAGQIMEGGEVGAIACDQRGGPGFFRQSFRGRNGGTAPATIVCTSCKQPDNPKYDYTIEFVDEGVVYALAGGV